MHSHQTNDKMRATLVYFLLAVLMLCGCKKTEQANCTCPPTIFLQPYDNYTQKEAKQLSKVLEKKFLELYGVEFEFEVLPNKKLSADLMNDSKSRFRADKIIDSLKKEASDHRIMIGLTHKDVVSDYRLKHKKRDYWKVVTHEFTHTACNYGHCPDDNPLCIMKDAKGKADFSNKVEFCKTCREKIKI